MNFVYVALVEVHSIVRTTAISVLITPNWCKNQSCNDEKLFYYGMIFHSSSGVN